MKILVIYDSFFGNTEKVAQAISQALTPGNTVVTKRVSQVEAADLQGLDWLFLGSPTRAFRPSEDTQAFLKRLGAGDLAGVSAAVFDTRIDPEDIKPGFLRFIVKKGGYAIKAMAQSLTKKGARLVDAGEGFFVLGSEGPLREGELDRTADWAKGVMANLK